MKYKAFISYSRVDGKAAERIHATLDRYRAPRQIIGTVGAWGSIPAKLHPIFMDRTDLAIGGIVANRLEAALRDSEALVVLCSAAAAASEWVDREVAAFLALGRSDRIFLVIIPGLLDPPDLETMFFPPALRGRGILAADFREIRLPGGKVIGDGWDGGRMKLLAGLLGVDLDQLRRRELQRAQAAAIRNGVFAVGAMSLFTLAAIGGVATFVSAVTAEDRANAAQIAESSFLSERAFEHLANGDCSAALKDSRNALPVSISQPDRPFVAMAQRALRAALLENREVARFVHDKPVGGAAFLVGSQTILTSEIGGHARTWDRTSGRMVQEWTGFETGDPAALTALDDDNAAIATSNGQIAVVTAGTEVVRVIGLSASKPRRLLAAGETLLAICDDATIHAWQWRDGTPLSYVSNIDVDRNAIALGKDGQVVAYVREGPTEKFEVVVASPSDLQRPVFETPSSRVFSLALSRDGKQVAFGTGFEVTTVDLASGRTTVLAGHSASVLDIKFNAAGDRLVSAGADGLAKVWQNIPNGDKADLIGHQGLIPSIVFTGDSRFAATLGRDRTIRLWAIDGSPRPAPIVLRGHKGAIRTLAMSPNEAYLVTASDDETARVWQIKNPAIRSIQTPPGKLSPLAWSESFQTILGLDSDNRLIEVDLSEVTVRQPRTFAAFTIRGSEFTARPAAAVSQYGFAGVLINDMAIAWRPGMAAPEPITLPGRKILQMRSARTTDAIAILADDRSIWVHARGRIRQIQAVPTGHFAAFTPSGDVLAIGQESGVALVNFATDKLIKTVSVPEPEGVEFSTDGRAGIAFSNIRSAIFVPSTGAMLGDISRPTVTATIAPAGDKAVGISGAGVVWVWNKTSGVLGGTTEARGPLPQAIALSPKGGLAAISQADGVIRLWATDSATLVGRIDTEGRGAKDLRFIDEQTLIALSDSGDRIEWRLPPICEDLLSSADQALSALNEHSNAPSPSDGGRPSLYLKYVRPFILPFVRQPGDKCASDAD